MAGRGMRRALALLAAVPLYYALDWALWYDYGGRVAVTSPSAPGEPVAIADGERISGHFTGATECLDGHGLPIADDGRLRICLGADVQTLDVMPGNHDGEP